MNLYLTLDAFADARETLANPKSRGMRTVILSNGSPQMLHAAVKNADIGDLLDAVFSVDEVGVYKPHLTSIGWAVERLGIATLSPFLHPMRGMPMALRPLACGSSGAIATNRGPSICPADRTISSVR